MEQHHVRRVSFRTTLRSRSVAAGSPEKTLRCGPSAVARRFRQRLQCSPTTKKCFNNVTQIIKPSSKTERSMMVSNNPLIRDWGPRPTTVLESLAKFHAQLAETDLGRRLANDFLLASRISRVTTSNS